ncbi:MAG: GNAT family N-acetyltransferase [Chitinophagaceae bacterium]|nr:GNAT family N-acetyltransferase [Chitinophagaceae bacterium]
MITLRILTHQDVPALCSLLINTVADGGSVSFMHPLSENDAKSFWEKSLDLSAQGKRVVLGAFNDNTLISTVTLLLDFPPNQPHRAEIGKMMTATSFRGKGIAGMLLKEAEKIARDKGRWHIVLDTAEDEGAAGFYEKMGYQRIGVIPEFALKPYGGLTGTILFYKKLT